MAVTTALGHTPGAAPGTASGFESTGSARGVGAEAAPALGVCSARRLVMGVSLRGGRRRRTRVRVRLRVGVRLGMLGVRLRVTMRPRCVMAGAGGALRGAVCA